MSGYALDAGRRRQLFGTVCAGCGLARPGELHGVGIAFDRRVTAERSLCASCAEKALAGMQAALEHPEAGETR